ncbi:MAG: NAD-dependent succinate-semialdehyde dehydrogenase [Inquilinus sp.]|nr:NAD-dependent succinate-semialdehyde dehydrogenase [Inquilinus sp.]
MYGDHGLYIDGSWRPAVSGDTYGVVNPADEEPLGEAPAAGPADVEAAIAAAERALASWRETQSWERARIIRRIGELLAERAGAIARVLTLEVGKPLAQAEREVQLAADQFEWYAEETKRLYGQIVESRLPGGRIQVTARPVGVVAAFTAWNFPVLLLARKIAPALAAGCSVICRPSIEAPGSAMALIQCCHDAGAPAGLVNLLTGKASAVAPGLMASPAVRKISLTGSTEIGKRMIKDAADTVKRVTMELGGHAPVIVFDDADAEAVAEMTVPVKFANTGQVCVSPSRFFVHESKTEAFARRFAEATGRLRIGNGLDPETQLGPLSTEKRRRETEALVADTESSGARLLTGGRRPAAFNRGYFYEPTVFDNVPDDARIMREEPFGPVVPITVFRDFNDVIERANALPLGLSAYVFTRSLKTAHEAADAIESGMVGVNTYGLAQAEAPFGGIKESGFGREGGSLGVRDYLDVKYTHMVMA